jgi:hypothetical protein
VTTSSSPQKSVAGRCKDVSSRPTRHTAETFCEQLQLVERLQCFSINHGWYVLKDRTEIHGTFYAQDRTLNSKRRLDGLRKELRENDLFRSLRLASIRLST